MHPEFVFLLRLIVAALLGAALGWEREQAGKSAGLRTHMLVSIASAAALRVRNVGQRLANGGRAPVRLILQMEKGREVEIALGDKFTVTPQIKGAIKAIPGVIDVQDL